MLLFENIFNLQLNSFPTKNIFVYLNEIQDSEKISSYLSTKFEAGIITDLNFLKNLNQEDKVLIFNNLNLEDLDKKVLLNFFEILDNENMNIILISDKLPKDLKTENEDIISRLNSYYLIKY